MDGLDELVELDGLEDLDDLDSKKSDFLEKSDFWASGMVWMG